MMAFREIRANESLMHNLRTLAAATVAVALLAGAGEPTAPPPDVPDPVAPAPSPSEAAPDVAAKGLEILKANCGRCHATGTDDTSKHAEAPPFRVVATRYPPENLAESLAEGIVSGHPDMPEFVFQPAEIEAILTYLGTLAPAPPASPGPEEAPAVDRE